MNPRKMFGVVALSMFLSGPALAQGEAKEEPGAPQPPDPRAIQALKLRFEKEPNVKEVQAAALKFFRVHPEKVESYLSGAAWKGILPDVEIGYSNDWGNSDRTLQDYMYHNTFPWKDYETTKNGQMSLSVRLHWALDRLIFNSEQLDVASLVGVQEGLLREVTSLYFTRRRILTSMILNPPQEPSEQLTEQLRLEEITANIDALTGGYLSRETQKRLNVQE
jgi:hypothetical protein